MPKSGRILQLMGVTVREEDVRLCISVTRGVSPFTSAITRRDAHLFAQGNIAKDHGGGTKEFV